jgi:hypothetical protein
MFKKFYVYMNIYIPPLQRLEVALCVVLLICVFGLDGKDLTPFLASPRVMLVCGILVWMRCEWRVGNWREESNTEGSLKIVRENYELSQTVLKLSDQHRLLCEIRTSVLKNTKYSREALSEIRCPVCNRCSFTDGDFTISPLVQSIDSMSRAKAALIRGWRSESCIQSTNPISRAKMEFRVGGKSESCVSFSEQIHE